MPKLEKDEEGVVKTFCHANGVLFIKFTPLGEKGWPDRIAVVNTYNLWIELKKKGKKPRPLQKYRMKQLAEHGAWVAWFDNAEDCIKWIRSFM